MKAPKSIKDVQRLNRCIASLGRFVFKSAERYLPFFKALKGPHQSFQWTEECGATWNELKRYLNLVNLLSKPKIGETLYLYLVASNLAVVVVLVREDQGTQKAVYYVCKALNETEAHYSSIEKLAYSLA